MDTLLGTYFEVHERARGAAHGAGRRAAPALAARAAGEPPGHAAGAGGRAPLRAERAEHVAAAAVTESARAHSYYST